MRRSTRFPQETLPLPAVLRLGQTRLVPSESAFCSGWRNCSVQRLQSFSTIHDATAVAFLGKGPTSFPLRVAVVAPPPNCVIKGLCPHLQGKGGARNAVAEAVVFPQNPFRRTRCGRKGIGFANLHFARRRFLHLPRFLCAFPLLHDVTASCRWWVRFLILRSLGLQRRHQGSQVFNAGARNTCGAVKPAIDASEESIDLAFAMLFGEEVNGITSLPRSTGELVYVCHEIPASEVRAHVRPCGAA